MTDNQRTILSAITEEIMVQAKMAAAEQNNPARDADDSDDFIKARKENVSRLRIMRENMEEIFSGMLP